MSLVKLFFHHEENNKIIIIIQQGSCYHLDPIPTRTDIDRKVGDAQGGQGINPPPPHQIDIDSEAMESVVHEGAQVTKPTPPSPVWKEITGGRPEESKVREGAEPRHTGSQERCRMQCRKRPPRWWI